MRSPNRCQYRDELRHRLRHVTGGWPAKDVDPTAQHLVNPLRHAGRAARAASASRSARASPPCWPRADRRAPHRALHRHPSQPLVSGLIRVVFPAPTADAGAILARLATAYLELAARPSHRHGRARHDDLHRAPDHPTTARRVLHGDNSGGDAGRLLRGPVRLTAADPLALHDLAGKAIVVAIIYIVAHEVESAIMQPVVIGRTVELHPAAVAMSVVAVNHLVGFRRPDRRRPTILSDQDRNQGTLDQHSRGASDQTFTGDLVVHNPLTLSGLRELHATAPAAGAGGARWGTCVRRRGSSCRADRHTQTHAAPRPRAFPC